MSAVQGCGDEDGPRTLEATDSGGLTQAFALAEEGDTVHLFADQVYTGHFEMPAGISLEGRGAQLVGNRAGPVLILQGGAASPSRIADLSIQNRGVGLAIDDVTHAIIEDMTIEVTAGAAMVVDGQTEGPHVLELNRVSLAGPVDEGVALTIGDEINPEVLPIAGLVVSKNEVRASELSITGFAGFGAVLFQCSGQWRGGSVSNIVGAGVHIEGGDMALEDLSIERGLQNMLATIVPFGLTAVSGASLTTSNLSIEDIDGVGLFMNGSTGHHSALSVRGSARPGLWSQNSAGIDGEPALRIDGGSVIDGNKQAGLQLSVVAGVVIEDTRVTNTIAVGMGVGLEEEPRLIGDGLQMTGVTGEVALTRVTISTAPRVAVLLDGEGAAGPTLSFEEVSLERGDANEGDNPRSITAQNGAEVDEDIAGLERVDLPPPEQVDALLTLDAFDIIPRVVQIVDEAEGLVGDNSFVDPQQGIVPENGRVVPEGIVPENG